jgi:flagellar biosynthesis protein FliP
MGAELATWGAMPAWVWLAALPLLLASCTAFTKVSVVLSALRIGLGAELLLPWSAVLALALVVSAVIMGPALMSVGPLLGDVASASPEEVLAPLSRFLSQNTSAAELEFFRELQGLDAEHPLVILPAFLVSELGKALHLAVLILLPFALLELVVAQIFTLMGLPGQPLALVTLPLKVLLFLGIGGWELLIGALVGGYTR